MQRNETDEYERYRYRYQKRGCGMHTIDIIILTVVAALLLLALRSTLRHYGGKEAAAAVVPAVREEALPAAPEAVWSRLWLPGNRQVRTLSPKRFRLKECTAALANSPWRAPWPE